MTPSGTPPTPEKSGRRSPSFPLTFCTFFAGIALAGIAWAFATPLAATPDEPSHLIKAASVVRGELIGTTTDEPAVTAVDVPGTIGDAHSWPCFAFHPEIDAACQPPFDEDQDLVEVTTSAGLYNPTYYAIVGWPSLFLPSSESAVFGMRIVSALACAALLAFGLAALSRVVRPLPMALATFGSLTPMVFFLTGALNPNGFEIAAGVALFGALIAVLARSTPPSRGELVMIAVSGVLLANTRGLSPLWMALIAAIAIVLTPWPRLRDLLRLWRVRVAILVLGLGAVAAASWTLATGTLGSLGTFPGAGSVSPLRAFFTMFTRVLNQDLIGVFGWLDTTLPPGVYAVWAALLLGVPAVALAVSRGRVRAALLLGIAGVVLVPPIVQAASITSSGYIWQGRYGLIALLVLILLSVFALSVSPRIAFPGSSAVVLGWLVAAAVVVAHVVAFATALRRYAVGADGPIAGFLDSEWAPPGGPVLWIAVLAAGVALVAVPLLVRLTSNRDLAEQEAAVSAPR